MTQNIVRLPSDYFGSFTQGRPVFNGSVYVGEVDLDPEIESNRKSVTLTQEDGTQVIIAPAGQPLITGSGGYISYQGSPVTVRVEGNYSIKVLDTNGVQVYYFPDVLDEAPIGPTEIGDYTYLRFDTVTDMVSSTLLDVGDYAITAGYNTIGDGGDNVYQILASGTGTPDGGQYIDLSTHQAKATFPKGIYKPEHWGVDGTASINDFEAWEAAVAFASAASTELQCTAGKIYLWDPTTNAGPNNGLTVALQTGQSLFIDMNNCEWKFKDGGVTDQFQHMLLVSMRTLFGSTNQLADYVEIKNGTLNGNRTNNIPPSPSAWEQSAAVKVQVLRNEGNELKHARFENIRQVDPIADTILIGPSEAVSSGEAGILNATVDGFHAGARNGTRSTVICGSGVSRVNLSNFTKDEIPGAEKNSIETEFTSIGTQNCEMNMSNIHIDDIELGGILGSEDQIQVNMVNVNTDISGFFLPVRCNVKASNCNLTVGIVNNWRMPRFEASNCTFNHLVYDNAGTQDVRSIANLTETANTGWQFDNCRFLVEGTPDPAATAYALDTGNISGAPEDFQFKFDNCTFDPLFPGTIDSFSGGTAITSNCKLAGTTQAVISGSFSSFHGSYRSYNDDWSAVTGTTFEANASVAPTGSMEIVGGKWATFDYTTGSSQWPALLSLGGRRRQVSSFVASGGLIGDVESLDSAAYAAAIVGADIERKCVSSDPVAATWKVTLIK